MNRKEGVNGSYVELYPGSDYDPTEFERACITVDTCICRIQGKTLQILMSKRNNEPFIGSWGFPGGFVDITGGESLEQASYRTLKTKTGASGIPVRQLGTYGAPLRDPRWRIITVVYYALVNNTIIDGDVFQGLSENEQELEHCWTSVTDPGPMAFDHVRILEDLVQRLQVQIKQTDIAFEMVPAEFTWSQLQTVYETVLDRSLPAGNFRRDISRIYDIKKLDRLEYGKGRGKGRTGALLNYKGIKTFP